uniref:Zn(2)-C6 fungal-type domain-containing protein n=1 Tax=Mycena chlorophos TaxID=658473 RepID=A0ABQ0LN69_MYCCL|nr:predicted protein [Mycena chlorophos]
MAIQILKASQPVLASGTKRLVSAPGEALTPEELWAHTPPHLSSTFPPRNCKLIGCFGPICVPGTDYTNRCARCQRKNIACDMAAMTMAHAQTMNMNYPGVYYGNPAGPSPASPAFPHTQPGPSPLPYTTAPPPHRRPRYSHGVPYPDLSLAGSPGQTGEATSGYHPAQHAHAYVPAPVHNPGMYRGMPPPPIPPTFPDPTAAYGTGAYAIPPAPIPKISGRQHLSRSHSDNSNNNNDGAGSSGSS